MTPSVTNVWGLPSKTGSPPDHPTVKFTAAYGSSSRLLGDPLLNMSGYPRGHLKNISNMKHTQKANGKELGEIKAVLRAGKNYKTFTNIVRKRRSVQFSSVAQSCPPLCDPMDCSMPGLPVHHQLLELTQTHVH